MPPFQHLGEEREDLAEPWQSKKFRDLISSLYSVAIINCGLMRGVDISRGTARKWRSQKCRVSAVASHPCIPASTSPGITQACSLNFSPEKWARWQKHLLTKEFAEASVLLTPCGFIPSAKVKRSSLLTVMKGSRDCGETPVFSPASLHRPTGVQVSSPGCAEGCESRQK